MVRAQAIGGGAEVLVRDDQHVGAARVGAQVVGCEARDARLEHAAGGGGPEVASPSRVRRRKAHASPAGTAGFLESGHARRAPRVGHVEDVHGFGTAKPVGAKVQHPGRIRRRETDRVVHGDDAPLIPDRIPRKQNLVPLGVQVVGHLQPNLIGTVHEEGSIGAHGAAGFVEVIARVSVPHLFGDDDSLRRTVIPIHHVVSEIGRGRVFRAHVLGQRHAAKRLRLRCHQVAHVDDGIHGIQRQPRALDAQPQPPVAAIVVVAEQVALAVFAMPVRRHVGARGRRRRHVADTRGRPAQRPVPREEVYVRLRMRVLVVERVGRRRVVVVLPILGGESVEVHAVAGVEGAVVAGFDTNRDFVHRLTRAPRTARVVVVAGLVQPAAREQAQRRGVVDVGKVDARAGQIGAADRVHPARRDREFHPRLRAREPRVGISRSPRDRKHVAIDHHALHDGIGAVGVVDFRGRRVVDGDVGYGNVRRHAYGDPQDARAAKRKRRCRGQRVDGGSRDRAGFGTRGRPHAITRAVAPGRCDGREKRDRL